MGVARGRSGVWLDVPDPGRLDELTYGRLPLGLGSPSAERTLFRDVYFDTAGGTLRRRGVGCRLRHTIDGQQTLAAWLNGSSRTALDIGGRRAEEVLMGDEPPARLVRAVVDPASLRPILEARTERHVRRARWIGLPWVGSVITLDRTEVWGGEFRVDVADVRVRATSFVGPQPSRIAEALVARHGLRPIGIDPLGRLWGALEAGDARALTASLRGPRECAVLLVRGGQIGLGRDGNRLAVLWGAGTGESACREVLGRTLGSAQGQIRCLGHAPSRPWQRPLEIWMARRLPPGAATDPAIEWLTLERAVDLAGAPLLRDARTLSALHVATQSDLLREQTGIALRVPAFGRPAVQVVNPPDADERYLDADISHLDFNARVLELAADPTLPAAVRAGYLAIVASNLDEFFMVRIGGLKRAVHRKNDGGSWAARLDGARVKARSIYRQMSGCLATLVLPALARDGTHIRKWADLSPAERARLSRRFTEELRPRLIPLAATSHHPFPHVGNTQSALAALLREPSSGLTHLATVSVPHDLPRLLALETAGDWIPLDAVICAHIASLFPGVDVVWAHAFRVTRSADIRYDEASGTDALTMVADAVGRRPFLPVVRLEVERSMPPELRTLLLQEFRFEHPDQVSDLDSGDIVEMDGLAGLGGLREISSALHCRLPLPVRSPFTGDVTTFDRIREGDVLVHFPYDSFDATVLRFLNEAAADPAVASVTLTLYRTGDRSSVVDALFRARAAGKDVVVLVELKARFDESRNIDSARALRAAGIQVVYGLPDLKVHAKIALVTRRESGALRRYAYIGTGNFHPVTAGLYTDLGLFTSHRDVCDELAALVDSLTGLTSPPAFQHLLVAPHQMLPRLRQLIQREIEHAKHGRPSGIRVKLNGLDDPEIVDALYEASTAGVQVELVVRGICTLRPGIPGLSDRIRVVSVLGEFLEHARVIHLVNGGQDEYFVGSADWRERNLRRRVEVYAPVRDSVSRSRLDHVLRVHLEDPSAWQLGADGRWVRAAAADHPDGSQRRLLRQAVEIGPHQTR